MREACHGTRRRRQLGCWRLSCTVGATVMTSTAVHRIIEHRAASRPDAVALIHGSKELTYFELNQNANLLARRLTASGLRRTSIAIVRLEQSIDLAVTLLAILKAGSAYLWVDPTRHHAIDALCDLCIPLDQDSVESRYLAFNLRAALAATGTSPNLPILSRSTDIACALPAHDGLPYLLVPHATITALASMPTTRINRWDTDPGAFDLWVSLMAGASVRLSPAADSAAA
jgi:acyl-CoA synthetase (AMP-forming)/AMP-acid ligase II